MGRRSSGGDGAGLEFVPDPDGLRGGAIGAAGREIPYWSLLDEIGRLWGRLCLLFKDEEEAIQEMRLHLERDHSEMLPHGVVRQLRDVDFSEDARVVKVPFRAWLQLELQKITRGDGNVQAPGPLLAGNFDVVRIVQQAYPFSYELIVVTEEALETDLVHCSPGHELVFETAA